MTSAITRKLTPEENELQRKRAELTALEAELAEAELELNTLEAELRAFQIRYLRTIGVRYAELDKIQAEIAAATARLNSSDRNAKAKAARAWTRAEESARAAGMAKQANESEEFSPPEDLKKLYRELAKRMHPDLASDEEERSRRTEFMARLNRAYQEGDMARMQTILSEWEGSPGAVKGEGIGAELIRVIRQIAQAQERLDRIRIMLAQLKESSLFKLREKVTEAEKQGRDLLMEMARKLEEQIESACERLCEVERYVN